MRGPYDLFVKSAIL